MEGHIDWNNGVRASIHGLHDGNHLLFSDYEVVGEKGTYTLDDHKLAYIQNRTMIGYDGPYRLPLEATQAP